MFGIGKKKPTIPVEIPEAMKPEDPVNYNSVLDYLVGLSDKDYKKVTGSAEIYRRANKEVAKLIGVKDEPTTAIVTEKPELTDAELNTMLDADPIALTQAFIDDAPGQDKPKKTQSTNKKVEVKDAE